MRITGLALVVALTVAILPHPSLGADEPLVPPGAWERNEYCRDRRIDDRNFRMAAQGPWAHISVEGGKALKQVGLYDRIVPGMLKLSSFDADSKDRPVFCRLAQVGCSAVAPAISQGDSDDGRPGKRLSAALD